MTLLLIGRTGQLAKALADVAKLEGRAVEALDRTALNLSWSSSRLTQRLNSVLSQAGSISGVINAAAYTQVDQAETDWREAFRVNATAPTLLASLCAARNLPFIHLSTDYVFSGEAAEPYQTDANPEPLNIYGLSKRAGEIGVRRSEGPYAIVRTSWVFDGVSPNFLTTMLRLAESKDMISVVNDQRARPTYTMDLARACYQIMDGLRDAAPSSIYHVTNSGPDVSWADFARAIFRHSETVVGVKDIPSEAFPTAAHRPKYTSLDLSDYEARFQDRLPDWEDALTRALAARQSAGL